METNVCVCVCVCWKGRETMHMSVCAFVSARGNCKFELARISLHALHSCIFVRVCVCVCVCGHVLQFISCSRTFTLILSLSNSAKNQHALETLRKRQTQMTENWLQTVSTLKYQIINKRLKLGPLCPFNDNQEVLTKCGQMKRLHSVQATQRAACLMYSCPFVNLSFVAFPFVACKH